MQWCRYWLGSFSKTFTGSTLRFSIVSLNCLYFFETLEVNAFKRALMAFHQNERRILKPVVNGFRKWLLAVNYFCKTLYLRCLIGFWIHLWKLFSTPEIKKLWFSGVFWYNRETLTRNRVKQKSCDSLIL